MANIPTPRSFAQILADILDSFLSAQEIEKIKVGGPLLSIFEAAAQSDTRSTQDLFTALDSQIIDNATGDALINLAADEHLRPIPVSPSSGLVNFGDSSFAKKSTSIYQGAAAPNVNSTFILVADASQFPAIGQIYIGRNTVNYEGPLHYTSLIQNVSNWQINLTSPTVKFHNLGESVVLAQGGIRQIPAGTTPQTPQANVNNAVQFSTIYPAQIEDGEVNINNIEVVASTPGTIGNVPAGAIRELPGAPYNGATVTNPLPFTNGLPAESEPSLRERIKAARQSRSKATSLAITSGVQGVSSPEDNKTVVSASIVKDVNSVSTLYIDDGNGYEESLAGIAQETLMDSALGGEQLFQLSSPRPVAKAFATTTLSAPFALSSGDILSVLVGGIRSEHTFSASSFTSIANATAYEVVASINGDASLLFSARTANQGTLVTIFAKADTMEDIEVDVPGVGNNANVALGFPTSLNYTLRLYKNDNFLYKDGESAIISSALQSAWSPSITTGATLILTVDNTSLQTITVTNADFINNNTGYTIVNSTNSLASWAKVFNAKIAGVTTAVNGGLLTFTSNLGPSSRASVSISGGTLFTNLGMFNNVVNPLVSNGKNDDYTLDRNLGQLKLSTQLTSGDTLIAGTEFTRGYVQSGTFSSGNVTLAGNGTLWLSVDGSGKVLTTGLTAATSLVVAPQTAPVARYTGPSNTFGSGSTPYIVAGDWVIVWDPAFTDNGLWRVSNVDTATWAWFEVERSTINAQTATPTSNGIVFVRTHSSIQHITVPAGTYSMDALATNLNTNLIGATATTYRNSKVRITTNTFRDGGDIILLSADLNARVLQLPVGIIDINDKSHFAVLEAGNNEIGTPFFSWSNVSAVSPTTVTVASAPIGGSFTLTSSWLKRLDAVAPHYGNNAGNTFKSSFSTGLTGTLRLTSKLNEWLVSDRIYFGNSYDITPYDSLNVILDNDLTAKNFSIPMHRNVLPNPSAVYGVSPFEVLDADNGNQSLFVAFGASQVFFNDFAAYMQARGKALSIVPNGTILFKYARFGREGEVAQIAFTNPVAPNQTFTVSPSTAAGNATINISLSSGNERTGLGIDASNPFIITSNKTYTPTINGVSRTGSTVTVNVNILGTGRVNNHTLVVGDVVYQQADDPSTFFKRGPKKVAATSSEGFSYTEGGSSGVVNSNTVAYYTSNLPAGTKYTVTNLAAVSTAVTATIGTHNYSAGNIVYFEPGHYDPVSGVEVLAGAKTITGTTGTTITWTDTASATATANLVSGIPYTISDSYCQKVTVDYVKPQVIIGDMSRTSTTVTVFTSQTPIILNHPYVTGDIVYLSPGEANFPSGPKIVTSYGFGTFTYTETGAAATSTVGQTFSSTASDPNLGSVSAGDIVNISALSPLSAIVTGASQVNTISGTNFTILKSDISYLGNSTPTKLSNTSYIRFYQLDSASNTSLAITNWVNANATQFVTAKLVPDNTGGSNNGSYVVPQATVEQFYRSVNNASQAATYPVSLPTWSLFDGLKIVSATNIDNSNSKISFKSAPNAELVSNADFANEIIRLVPITSQGVANFLGSTAISGLGANGKVTTSSDGNKFQIVSNTIGSLGSVQISGGTANSAAAFVIGSGDVTTLARIKAPTAQLDGFTGLRTVSLQGTYKANKVLPIGLTTTMEIASTIDPTTWLIRFGGTGSSVVNVLQVISSTNTYQIERYGKFMGYVDISTSPTALSGAQEGDWVYISSASISPLNTGIRQIVRIDSTTNTFWVENPGGVEQVVTMQAGDFIKFISQDSVMPGDALTITSSIVGAGNIGNFTVSALSETGASTTATEFFVKGSLIVQAPTTLGSSYIFVQVQEASPIKLYKLIRSISPSVTAGVSDVLFTTTSYITKVNESVQSAMTAEDKFAFSTNIAVGLDAYSYNTGLLQEVNRVVYGDETNPSVYPGLIATGTNLNISGPLIKRIQVALSVRLRTGVSSKDVIERIKSAVASVINTAKVGESIAFSDIITAANTIDGVLSVTILSPTYNSSNDLIPVQINEKPKVLDVTQDVLVSIVG